MLFRRMESMRVKREAEKRVDEPEDFKGEVAGRMPIGGQHTYVHKMSVSVGRKTNTQHLSPHRYVSHAFLRRCTTLTAFRCVVFAVRLRILQTSLLEAKMSEIIESCAHSISSAPMTHRVQLFHSRDWNLQKYH